ncbi:hypothetical protein EVAR_31213_1 [Eumeta japonica]|uniref:Uncharacterized protein n=1 Tax=Eumeta variegata TaxID=151549 RepID=A0A4C1VYL0_EUMVA|nr:hypothetical protein EVAR_31213_1 [Eumeta japonica]
MLHDNLKVGRVTRYTRRRLVGYVQITPPRGRAFNSTPARAAGRNHRVASSRTDDRRNTIAYTYVRMSRIMDIHTSKDCYRRFLPAADRRSLAARSGGVSKRAARVIRRRRGSGELNRPMQLFLHNRPLDWTMISLGLARR